MFLNCSSLESIPSFNMLSVTGTSLSQFASNTLVLKSLTINAPLITTLNYMFHYAFSSPTLGNTASAIFNSGRIKAIKDININCSGVNATISAAPFNTTFTNVTSIILTGLRYAVSVTVMRLDGAALDALYTSLGTAAGAQTLTVTTNHGTVDDTPSIATAKGWTVSGS
jgi:hypothetical protein